MIEHMMIWCIHAFFDVLNSSTWFHNTTDLLNITYKAPDIARNVILTSYNGYHYTKR